MANRKITQFANLGGAQSPTMIMPIVDPSLGSVAAANLKSTLNDLFADLGINTTDGASTWTGKAVAPSVSAASKVKVYYSTVLNQFLFSRNAGAYLAIAPMSSASPLTAGNMPYVATGGVLTKTASPGATIDSFGVITTPYLIMQSSAGGLNGVGGVYSSAAAQKWEFQLGASNELIFYDFVNSKNVLKLTPAATPTLTAVGNFVFGSDNTFNIGAASATRPAGVYVGGVLQVGRANNQTGTLTFLNSANAFTTGFQAGAAAASRTYTWPLNFGVAGSVLTDAAGDGTLSWATAGLSNPYLQDSGSSAAIYFQYSQNTPSVGRWGVERGSGGATIFTGASLNAVVFGSATASLVEFFYNDTKQFTIPTALGSSGQFLQTNGAGVTSWATPSGTFSGSLATNQIAYGSAANTIAGSNNLWWDFTNNRLGVGTNAPNEQLEITLNFRLPTTSSTAGIIKVGATRFLHSYGTNNVYIGLNAGNFTQSGTGSNTGIGRLTLSGLTTGYQNTVIGDAVAQAVADGHDNVLIGVGSAGSITSGAYSVIIGSQAAGSFNGDSLIAIGRNAANSGTGGAQNIAIGQSALNNHGTTSTNTAVGHFAVAGALTAGNNSGFGRFALNSVTGGGNTAIGEEAGTAVTSGANNILVGFLAGYDLTTGSKNIIIGHSIKAPNITASNQINIGNILFGTGVSGTSTTIAGLIGIGTASPGAQFHVLSTGSSTIGQIIQLAATPNVDAVEVQNNSGTVLSRITKEGYGTFGSGVTAAAVVTAGGVSTGGAYVAAYTSSQVANDAAFLGTFGGSAITGLLYGVTIAGSATQGIFNTLLNSENATGTAHCSSRYTVGGGSAGDPFINLAVSGAGNWSFGIRNSDADNFYLNAASDLSTANVLKVTSAGACTWIDGGSDSFGTTNGWKFATSTSQKMGWWNVTPVVQQILATGAGATVDNVISLLQTLGLCRQS